MSIKDFIKKSGVNTAGLVTAGSIREYEGDSNNSKNLNSLIKYSNQLGDIKDKITRLAIKGEDISEKALKLAKKMKEDEFPEDTRSNEGKGGQEYTYEKTKDAYENIWSKTLNIRMG